MANEKKNKLVLVNIEAFILSIVNDQQLYTEEVKYVKRKLEDLPEYVSDISDKSVDILAYDCPPYILDNRSDDWCKHTECDECWKRWLKGELHNGK